MRTCLVLTLLLCFSATAQITNPSGSGGGASYPGVTSDGASGLTIVGSISVAGIVMPVGTPVGISGTCRTPASVTTPAASNLTYFCNSSNSNHLSTKDSAATIVDLQSVPLRTVACLEAIFNSPATNDIQYALPVSMASTAVGWAVQAVGGTSPTVSFDIFKDSDGGTTLPTVSIVASAPPALATGNRLRSTTLTGWTPDISAYDVMAAKVTAVTGSPTQVSVSIFCTR